MVGGDRQDTIRGGQGNDTIIDFEDGLDMIELARPTPGDGFADLTVETRSGFTAVFWTANPGDVILLKDITVDQITEADINFA